MDALYAMTEQRKEGCDARSVGLRIALFRKGECAYASVHFASLNEDRGAVFRIILSACEIGFDIPIHLQGASRHAGPFSRVEPPPHPGRIRVNTGENPCKNQITPYHFALKKGILIVGTSEVLKPYMGRFTIV